MWSCVSVLKVTVRATTPLSQYSGLVMLTRFYSHEGIFDHATNLACLQQRHGYLLCIGCITMYFFSDDFLRHLVNVLTEDVV